MARIIIDVSAAGAEWIKDVLPGLVSCKNVIFVYSSHTKYRDEVFSNRNLAQLFKLMKEKKRRDDTDPEICERLISDLNKLQSWKSEGSCDDPHIFAMAYQKPSAFVFTADKRMVKCKGCMKQHIDKKFRSFSTIQSRSNFDTNEHKIKA
ncbi:hypothetical protein ABVB72_10220 [Rhizobium nepotum]|uniref:hypothetical protein n=1 Tax=Rhizobium nepotum TaxID=1035271 RepID=UPI003369E3CB